MGTIVDNYAKAGTPDRRQVIELVEEAVEGGCRWAQACSALEISIRTYQRWMRDDGVDNDQVSHRKQVYEAAKQRHPERCTGATRDWELSNEVWLIRIERRQKN